MKKDRDIFTNVDLPIMIYNTPRENKYKVYSNQIDYIIITADNASSAIEISKIENPYKIEHLIDDLIFIIDKNELSRKNI